MNKNKYTSFFIVFLFTAGFFVLASTQVEAANRYSRTTGNWNSASTWSDSCGGSQTAVPLAGDDVEICIGNIVTVNANTANLNSLTISDGGTLSVSANYTVTATTINVDGTYTNASTGAIGGDSLTISNGGSMTTSVNMTLSTSATINTGGSIAMSGSGGNVIIGSGKTMTVDGGSINTDSEGKKITVTGNLEINSGTVTVKDLDGAGTMSMSGGTLTLSHDYKPTTPGNFVATGGTVTFTGSNGGQGFNASGTYSFYNLTLSSGTQTANHSSATISVANNLSFTNGKLILKGSGNTAKSLFLDGVKQVSGTWGSTASSATNKDNTYFVSGTGIITIETSLTSLTLTGAVAQNKVYDGSNSAVVNFGSASLVGIEDGDEVSIDVSGYQASFDNKNVGNNKEVSVDMETVSLTGDDAGNYTLSEITGLTANITPKSVSSSGVTAKHKEDDGSTLAQVQISAGALLTGVIDGDDVSINTSNPNVSGTFDNINVGNGKTVTVSGVLIGADAGNYTLFTNANITERRRGGGGGGGSRRTTTTTTTSTTPAPTSSQTLSVSELQAIITDIVNKNKSLLLQLNSQGVALPLAVLQMLNLPQTGELPIARDLYLGLQGNDVRSLQELLINLNMGPKAKVLSNIGVTGLFGVYTRDALAEYQVQKGINPFVGYFGPVTRNKMKTDALSGLWW